MQFNCIIYEGSICYSIPFVCETFCIQDKYKALIKKSPAEQTCIFMELPVYCRGENLKNPTMELFNCKNNSFKS